VIECQECGVGYQPQYFCKGCSNCLSCCTCSPELFDADELGLDPESDNTPKEGSRHA